MHRDRHFLVLSGFVFSEIKTHLFKVLEVGKHVPFPLNSPGFPVAPDEHLSVPTLGDGQTLRSRVYEEGAGPSAFVRFLISPNRLFSVDLIAVRFEWISERRISGL